MVNVHARLGVPSQQVLPFLENELLFSSRQDVTRQETVQPIRRHRSNINIASCQIHIRTLWRDWRNEPVALTDDRLDEPRVFGVIAQRPPDFADGRVHCGVLVDEHIRSPEYGLNFSAIHEYASSPDEEDQYLHRNLFDLDTVSRARQRVRGYVQFELAKTEAARHRPTDHTADPVMKSSEKVHTVSMAIRSANRDHVSTQT
jgi:hypothetical protein